MQDFRDKIAVITGGASGIGLGIARAIVTDPTVVVADEPTGDLDSATSSHILDLLQRLNSELGTTLLMVTHDADAAAIAGRQLRLDDGRLISDERNETVLPSTSEGGVHV